MCNHDTDAFPVLNTRSARNPASASLKRRAQDAANPASSSDRFCTRQCKMCVFVCVCVWGACDENRWSRNAPLLPHLNPAPGDTRLIGQSHGSHNSTRGSGGGCLGPPRQTSGRQGPRSEWWIQGPLGASQPDTHTQTHPRTHMLTHTHTHTHTHTQRCHTCCSFFTHVLRSSKLALALYKGFASWRTHKHTHAYTCTHAHTRTHTHARTHTHTHTRERCTTLSKFTTVQVQKRFPFNSFSFSFAQEGATLTSVSVVSWRMPL